MMSLDFPTLKFFPKANKDGESVSNISVFSQPELNSCAIFLKYTSYFTQFYVYRTYINILTLFDALYS